MSNRMGQREATRLEEYHHIVVYEKNKRKKNEEREFLGNFMIEYVGSLLHFFFPHFIAK